MWQFRLDGIAPVTKNIFDVNHFHKHDDNGEQRRSKNKAKPADKCT